MKDNKSDPRSLVYGSVHRTVSCSLLILLSITSLDSFAQTFEKAYGGTSDDFGYTVRQTTDSGYIMIGGTHSYGAGSRDFYLIKTDQNGDTTWTKTFGSTGFDYGNDVAQTADGGYILTGTLYQPPYVTFVARTDSNGDTLWTNTYTGKGKSIEQTTDSGFIIAGNIWLGVGAGKYDMLLIRIDANGDTIWTKNYGHTQSDGANDVKQTDDGGYILVGFEPSNGTDIWLVKTDVSGDTLWTKSYGGTGYENAFSVELTTDNGYIILGHTTSFGSKQFYLIKTDSLGDTLWTRTYDNGNTNGEGYEVRQTSDGGYVFVAETDKNGFGYVEVYLVKTDDAGDTLWTRTYEQGSGNGLDITFDSGYVLLGFTDALGISSDFYLIKTDSNGNIDVVLDIELIFFKGTCQKTYNVLEWQTASEHRFRYFEIERSSNAREFEDIGIQQGQGRGAYYSWRDGEPLPGMNYYRLKLTNTDGSYSYSDIVAIQSKSADFEILKISPVPANDAINVSFITNLSGVIKITLYDLDGKRVLEKETNVLAGLGEAGVEIDNLDAGIYLIQLTDSFATQISGRFIKQ